MKMKFDHAAPEAPGICSFHFAPEKPIDYVPGQFVDLSLPLDGPDKPFTMRQFTLSSSPTEKHLSITTRLDDRSGPFKQALKALAPGDIVDMTDPIGDFVLPIDITRPLIFVAGGIGITPFRSMLAWLADKEEKRLIKLMYAVRTEDDIIFLDDFQSAGQHATIVVEKPSASWGGERGHLTADIILGVEHPTADSLVYLSGPDAMITALADDLRARGLRPDQLVTDLFTGYSNL